jgi:hypothetical protein
MADFIPALTDAIKALDTQGVLALRPGASADTQALLDQVAELIEDLKAHADCGVVKGELH